MGRVEGGPREEVQSPGAGGFNLKDPGRFANGPIEGGQPLRKDQDPTAENLSRAIITDLRGYNAWLQKRDDFCIDMDLAPWDETQPILPIDQQGAMRRFKSHIASIETIPPEDRSDTLDLSYLRLRGLVAYREEIERVERGEPKTEYKQLFREVNWFEPPAIKRAALDEAREECIDYLGAVGYPPRSSDEQDVAEAFRNYHESHKLTSPKEILDEYRQYAERYRSQLSQTIGQDLSFVNYDTLTKYTNAFWRFYERGGPSGFQVWFNWHQRHRDSYDTAVVQAYSPHEDFHETKGQVLGQRIKSGELEPLAGLITIPGPDSFAWEGEAIQIHNLAEFRLTPDTRLGTAIYHLSKLAIADGIYRVEGGEPANDVARDLAKYMPLNSVEEFEALLREATTKTFDRVYQPIYGIAGHQYRELSQNLLKPKKIRFIKYSLETPRSWEQFHDLVGYLAVS